MKKTAEAVFQHTSSLFTLTDYFFQEYPMPAFVDTHAHYFDRRFEEFDGGLDALLGSYAFRSVTRAVINVGTSPRTNALAVEQAARYPWMVAAVGIHPEDAQGLPAGDALDPEDELCGLLSYLGDKQALIEDKIVAIGEIGLDYHWEPMDRRLQKAFFDGQMEIARVTGLPVIVHDREAHGDCFETVLRYPGVRGVFHGYSGSAEMARELCKRGWYIAFGGTVTFKNAERVRAVARSVPPDHLLLETDCPYMAPVPHRGKTNHSAYIPFIAEVIADLHGITVENVAEITTANADRLFGLSRFVRL